MTVLVLIANPAAPVLSHQLLTTIQHSTGGEINWLNRHIAAEIVGPEEPDSLAIAREAVGTLPLDVAEVSATHRKKQLLVADMDSTMIEQECIDELADAVGIKAEVAAITERAMNGELNFEQALRTRVGLIKGLERRIIEEIRRERITLAPGSRALVQTMRSFGAYTSLVSGGFTIFADYIARRSGFDEAVANALEFNGDVLTGTVASPIVDKTTKLDRLTALATERNLPMAATLAVGDGANDLDMIRAAGMGVAIHAKPHVAAAAGVRIDHGDLTSLLYLQGYTDEDIVR